MPEATFVVHLDDFQGFVVTQRYPSTLTLNEKVINLIFYEQEKEKEEELGYSEIEGKKIASYRSTLYPGWMVCTILQPDEEIDLLRKEIAGSGRLILALISEDPDSFSLEEILQSGSVLKDLTEEQQFAEIFLTPSSALLLERMQAEGIEKAAKLSIWLKSQIQEDVDLREAMAPLMQSGVVTVELLGKASEMVFLVKDLMSYREPPLDAITNTKNIAPELAKKYTDFVEGFFSPPPPGKGYNPVLPVDDPNSPILEDRERISKILSEKLQYRIITSLRTKPLSIADISQNTTLPESVVTKILHSLESAKVAVHFVEEGLWALLTNPRIQSFMPEYVLPLINEKLSSKEITPEAAHRHLELLMNTWGEVK
jgi:hypothetical protein